MTKFLRLTLPVVLISAVLSACSTGGDTPGKTADTTSPTVALVNLNTSVTQAGPVTFKASASDNVGVKSVDFYVDDKLIESTTTAYQTPYTWTITQNGPHKVKAVATDTSGNTAETVQTVTVAIPDTTRPVVTISGVPDTTITTAGTYTVSVAATDDVGVVNLHGVLTYTNPAGTTATLVDQTSDTQTSLSLPISVDSSRNGTYTLTVTATDAAGNIGTATQTVVVALPQTTTTNPTTPTTPTTPAPDTEKPVVTIKLPATPITAAGNYAVTVSATDNVGVVKLWGKLTLPNGFSTDLSFAAPGGTQTINVSSIYNGTSSLVVYAQDAAGNIGSQTASITVAIP